MEKITVKGVNNGYIIEVETIGWDNTVEASDTYVESDEAGLQRRLGEIAMRSYNNKNYYTDGSVINITIE